MPEKMREAIARMKPTLLLLLFLALVAIPALSVSCAGQAVTYTDVTAEEAYVIISQQEVVVLDVRTPEEYALVIFQMLSSFHYLSSSHG